MSKEEKFDFEAYSGQKPSEPKFLLGPGGPVPNPNYLDPQKREGLEVFSEIRRKFAATANWGANTPSQESDEDPEFREFMKMVAEQEISDIKKIATDNGISISAARKLLDKIGRAKLFNIDTDDANRRLQRLTRRCLDRKFGRSSTFPIDIKSLSHLDPDTEAEAYAEILKKLGGQDFESIKSYQGPKQRPTQIPIPLPPTPKQLTTGNGKKPSKPEKKTPVVNESLFKNTIDGLKPGQSLAFPIHFKYVQKYMNNEGRFLGPEYKIHVILTSGSKDDVDIVVFQRGIPFKMNHYAATEYNFKDPRKVASAPDHCDVIEMKDGNWNQ